MSDIRALEHPTLKVPYEHLNKKFRYSFWSFEFARQKLYIGKLFDRSAQKIIDREVSYVQSAVGEVEKALQLHDADPQKIASQLVNFIDIG